VRALLSGEADDFKLAKRDLENIQALNPLIGPE